MKYSVLTQDAYKQKTDCLILGIPEGKSLPKSLTDLDGSLDGLLKGLFAAGDISSNTGEVSWVHTPDKPAKRLLFVGLGKSKELDAAKTRKAISAVMSALAKSSAGNAVSTLSEYASKSFPNDRIVEHSILALENALYKFDQLKSEKAKPGKLKQLKLTGTKADSEAVTKATAIAKGVALTKDLGNLPGNICTPEYLATQAKDMAKSYKSVKTTVLDEKKMKELGMGSLLSVAAGSAEPPRLITIEYKGADSKQKPHVLVGKGITFDTGGISLKPGQSMDEMKYDMCGAASVFGTLTALAEMNAPINVVGVVAAAENMPGGKATKPGDIVTSMSGQTIEILNTDAEGRLVLCDALTYCEKFNPQTVVDIATLTGACIIALGNETTGLMANDEKLAQEILAAGQASGDRAWQLPLWDEYQSALDSNFADMQNIGDRAAGTITAACFLSRFTKKYRWAHLDIAGVAWTSGKAKGASGRPVPMLTEYLLNKL
ncbi:leucyl aminopeptidase [Hahella ganghwensis]|uniref:leucyl aminopeptidase n=1 Tax=Hahella ganghwensis TaxID=286420 RepID=UPI00036F69D1|nr:leucyl aminopeptidase [Hahella ganghwensis]